MKRVNDLRPGDQVFTPAARWETVTDVEDRRGYCVRLFTDRTGPAYAWSIPGFTELPAVDAVTVQRTPTVRLHENRDHVTAYLGTHDRPWGSDVVTLADAVSLGRGKGWQVRDRPTGGDLVLAPAANKAAATSLVKRAAKAHAKALGLALHRPPTEPALWKEITR